MLKGFDRRHALVTIALATFALVTYAVYRYAEDIPFDSSSRLSNFWTSLSASFIEDLTFFIIVGLLGLIITLSRPSDEALSRRIRFLFNGKNVSTAAEDSLQATVKKLALFCPSYTLNIEFDDHDASLEAVKATVNSTRTMGNFFSDIDLRNVNLPFNVYSDLVGDVDQIQGEMLTAMVSGEPDLISSPRQVKGEGREEVAQISINRNSFMSFSYKFWVWFKIGADYSVDIHSFTEKMTINIKNSSSASLKLYFIDSGTSCELTPGMAYPYILNSLPDGRRKLFTLREVAMPDAPGGG